jgi:riboflavin synthase
MRIGVADTTFARIDMGNIAVEELKEKKLMVVIERYTVPGFKDLPVAAKLLIEKYKCDIVIACGWVGKEEVDEVCAHEANTGLIQAELMTNTHILKVFFHEKETDDLEEQKKIATERVRKHALNAVALMKGKESLTPQAGKGLRQGYGNAGGLK